MTFDTENRSGTKTLLIVDDDPIIIEVNSFLLSELGYQVISADSGDQAIEIYGQNKDDIDLVILDMMMPGLSGEQTFEALQALDDQVKVIISTGFARERGVNKLLDNGCLACITKPYEMAQLNRKIQDALS